MHSIVRNRVLWQRLFRYNPNSNQYPNRDPTVLEVDTYLPAVFNGQENNYFGAPAHFVGGAGGVPDERAVMHQREFSTEPFQFISGGLHGCTMVTLISNRAVWQAHFWEPYSHGSPSEDTTRNAAFTGRVLRALTGEEVTNPASNSWRSYIPPSGPPIDPNLFNRDTDETEFYIMTPFIEIWKRRLINPRTPKRLAEIRKAIERHIGVAPKDVTYKYIALNYSDLADLALVNISNRGMALFQYDPDSDGNGQRAWRLFYEVSFKQKMLF
ncbi:hypothetical protein MaudCBS49596_005215 [Microsporum audouinii]